MVGESFLEQDWYGEVAAFPSDSYKRFFLAALPLGPPINTPPPLIQHMKFQKSLSHGISYAGAWDFSSPSFKIASALCSRRKKRREGLALKLSPDSEKRSGGGMRGLGWGIERGEGFSDVGGFLLVLPHRKVRLSTLLNIQFTKT